MATVFGKDLYAVSQLTSIIYTFGYAFVKMKRTNKIVDSMM